MDTKEYKRAIEIITAERVPGFIKMSDEIRQEIAYAFVAYFRALDKENFIEGVFLEACKVGEGMLSDADLALTHSNEDWNYLINRRCQCGALYKIHIDGKFHATNCQGFKQSENDDHYP